MQKTQNKPENNPPPLPLLPLDELEAQMPYFLGQVMAAFDDENEKAVALISGLVAASSLFPNVSGVYDRRQVRSNLYALIMAEAASGKGAMTCVERLVRPVDDYFHASSPPAEEGKPVQQRLLIVPANTSKARLLQHLQANPESTLMLESEADTLKSALKADHGGFTDVLRQFFHHETARKSMVKDGLLIKIEDGGLSVCLTGTPEQVSFIDTVENGLFSRFLFYHLADKFDWRDVSPQAGRPSHHVYFAGLAQELFAAWGPFKAQPWQFELSPHQWADLNTKGRELTAEVKEMGLEGKELRATVRRLMLIAYRISMTFTSLEALRQPVQAGPLRCPARFFDAAMTIADVCFDHAQATANRMLKRPADPYFTAKQLEAVAEKLGITLSNLHNKIIPKLPIKRIGQGKYERDF